MKDFLAKLNAFLAFAWPYVVMLAEWLIAKVKAAFNGFLQYLAPVADSVKGKLNSEEVQRVITKAVTSGGMVTILGVFTNPDFVNLVIVPTVITFVVAILDGARRCRHGECADANCPHA